MNIQELRKVREQLHRIAARYGIRKVYVFGSTVRGESTEISDVDFLLELDEDASALGIGAFQYETQQLLGIAVDVIPTFALPYVEDRTFIQSVQSETVTL